MKYTQMIMALALSGALALGCAQEDKTIVKVDGGKILGVETSIEGVYVFKGVPYAAPPIGNRRWKEPQPVIPWDGVRPADDFSAAAVQDPHIGNSNPYNSEFFFQGDPPFSEDCLYLNVWTPAPGERSRKLPVAIWIHGGAYTGGWGFEPEMDGKVWGSKDVILVTINYRLGIFGFLAHPLLSEESEHGVSGNYGILDQIAAVKWVHDNITAFGGDPNNITIFGQSAGAGSVKTLVSSPLTGNLIKKAIIMSGGGVSDRPLLQATGLEEIAQRSKEVFDWAGYDTLEKMRAASTEEIYSLPKRYTEKTGKPAGIMTRPIVDGYVSIKSFDDAARDGSIKDIPYMIGFTRDDMGALGAGIDRFCELRNATGTPVYAYQFARRLPDSKEKPHDMKGAFHSSELWYVFHSQDHSDRPFTPLDKVLADHVNDCWVNFVKTGDPGRGWFPYTPEHPLYMVFQLTPNETDDASAMMLPLEP